MWPDARTRRRWALLPLLALWGLLHGGAATALSPAQAQADVPVLDTVRIDAALSASGYGDAFPAGNAQPVALPDAWPGTWPGAPGHSDAPVWYRVGFRTATPPARHELMALYIARVCSNLEVFLNGRRIHSGGHMREPLTHNCNHPQLVVLPAALIEPGANTLDLRVVGYPATHVASLQRAGGLSALEIGPHDALARRHARETALRVGVPQAVSATLVLMGGFMFVMGWINRRESHLAYFGALSFGWAIVESRLWLRELPFPGAVAEFLLASLMPFVTLAAVQFLLRYARWRHRWIDLWLPLQCALMPTTLVLAGPARLQAMTSLWFVLLALQALAAVAFYLHTHWQSRRGAFWPMALLLSVITLGVAMEFLALHIAVPLPATLLAQLATPVLFVAVGLRLVQQHGQALQTAEATRVGLEARIREATAEIERNFRQLSELRVEQVTDRERKRIAADLHDDLGAKLLTIVHTSDSERISTLAREALEEMRLSVRGLTGKPVRLADALGDWRAEVVSRLAQAGIEAEWSAPEDLPQTLSSRAYVQTTRILREATSNIIKHSGASHCAMRCTIAEGDFQLVIQDNGGGIPLELDGRLDRGHGMASMKHRAKQLQGQCLVESGPGLGTVIRLTIPLGRATEASV